MGWLDACFADLPDPRTGNATRHNLLEVLTIALIASICGAESCVDFADFGRDRERLFREFLTLENGLPSHDTFSRMFRLLDPAAFTACFARFLDGLGEDGRGVLASFDEDRARNRSDHGPENLAILRRLALNVLRSARPDISIRRKRKRSGWSDEFARSVLGQMR